MGTVEIYQGQMFLKEWNKNHDEEGHMIKTRNRTFDKTHSGKIILFNKPSLKEFQKLSKGIKKE